MDSTMHWFSTAFDGAVGFFPALIAGLIILLVGYVVAKVCASLVRKVLRRTQYDHLLKKIDVIDNEDEHEGSRWTGSAVYALVILAAIMQAARAWNLQMLANGIGQIIAYVPHLIGAAVIFGAALYFANWVRERIVRGEKLRPGQRPIAASAVRAGVLALGAFMALRELQIAPEIVTIAFTLTLAAIALAAALAFGLGSRGVAGQVTQQWFDRQASNNGYTREPAATSTQTWPGQGTP